jgi:hypothetical protein
MSASSKLGLPPMPISTVLTPSERARVDAAAEGLYSALHRDSFDEVIADLRERRAAAVLVSIARYGLHSSARMAAMVREFPRVPAMALLSEIQYTTPQSVLALGQLGVRILIDTRQPSGWQTLRDILSAERSSDLQRTALGHLSGRSSWSSERLLALLRASLQSYSANTHRSAAFPTAVYSTQYPDEPVLSG